MAVYDTSMCVIMERKGNCCSSEQISKRERLILYLERCTLDAYDKTHDFNPRDQSGELAPVCEKRANRDSSRSLYIFSLDTKEGDCAI